jgi:nucleoside-diphosphate-sugar epimerase
MSDGARRVLITGASAGIGRACAGELHAAGWAVTGASRRGTTWPGRVLVDGSQSSAGLPASDPWRSRAFRSRLATRFRASRPPARAGHPAAG